MHWGSKPSSLRNLFKQSSSRSLLSLLRRESIQSVEKHDAPVLSHDKITDEQLVDKQSEVGVEHADHADHVSDHSTASATPEDAAVSPATNDYREVACSQQSEIDEPRSDSASISNNIELRATQSDVSTKNAKRLMPMSACDSNVTERGSQDVRLQRTELQEQLALGSHCVNSIRKRCNDRIYRESLVFLELKRLRLAELRKKLYPPDELKQYAKALNKLSVWERSLPMLENRLRRSLQSRVDDQVKSVVKDPNAVYERHQVWRSEADLRRATATIDRDLQEMINRGFLARAHAALSFSDWKAHTEYRFRKFFYDDIESDIADALVPVGQTSSVL